MNAPVKKAAPAASHLELKLKAMSSALGYTAELASAGSRLMAIALSENVDDDDEKRALALGAQVLFDVAGHVSEYTIRATGEPGWLAEPRDWLLPYGTRELLLATGGQGS